MLTCFITSSTVQTIDLQMAENTNPEVNTIIADPLSKIRVVKNSIGECKNTLENLLKEKNLLKEDPAIHRALMERLVGPLPSFVTSVKLDCKRYYDEMELVFQTETKPHKLLWNPTTMTIDTDVRKIPSELVNYGKRFMEQMENPELVEWMNFLEDGCDE